MSNKGIPNPELVKKALELTDKRLKNMIHKINITAAKCTKIGNYDDAAKFVEIAKVVSDYRNRLKSFSKEWQTIVKSSRIISSSVKTKNIVKPDTQRAPT